MPSWWTARTGDRIPPPPTPSPTTSARPTRSSPSGGRARGGADPGAGAGRRARGASRGRILARGRLDPATRAASPRCGLGPRRPPDRADHRQEPWGATKHASAERIVAALKASPLISRCPRRPRPQGAGRGHRRRAPPTAIRAGAQADLLDHLERGPRQGPGLACAAFRSLRPDRAGAGGYRGRSGAQSRAARRRRRRLHRPRTGRGPGHRCGRPPGRCCRGTSPRWRRRRRL